MINYLALAIAVILSGVAAYYSVIGLALIFAGAFWPVVVMGGVLEAAKLVTASWLYRYWHVTPKLIKGYFISAITILMLLTSMGIFGFLSKAHIEHTTKATDNSYIIKQLEQQIQIEEKRVSNAQRNLDALNRELEGIDIDKVSRIRNSQARARQALNNEIKDANGVVKKLQTELLPLQQESAKAIAEFGPLKYVAELIYGEQANTKLDSAVRIVIIMLIFVFDPLAVLLIIAVNIGFSRPEKTLIKKRKKGTIEIEEKLIQDM